MAGANSYANLVRAAMRATNNPLGREVTIRDLEKALGYSYEHIRKVLQGAPFGSRSFNDALCKFLNLNPDEMWTLAQREKLTRKFGPAAMQMPKDDRLARLLPRLTQADIDRLIQIAEGMAIANEELQRHAERQVRTRTA